MYQQVNIWAGNIDSSSYTRREYDKYGNLIKIYSGRFDNDTIQEFKIRYEYDLYGNWIRMEYYNQHNKLSEVRRRSISYY